MSKKPYYMSIFKKCILPNLISAIIIIVYANLFGNTTLPQILISFIGIGVMVLISEFAISPFTCKMLYTGLSKQMYKWQNKEIEDYKERTSLYVKVMNLPLYQSIHTMCFFMLGSVYVFLFFHFVPGFNLDWINSFYILVACLFGTYVASLFNFFMMERMAFPIAEKLVEEGLDEDYIMKKRYFGLSPLIRSLLFLVIPVVFVNLFVTVAFAQTFPNILADYNASIVRPETQIIRIGSILLFDLLIMVLLVYIYFDITKKNTTKLTALLTEVHDTGSTTTKVDASLCDLMQYSNFILNKIVQKFDKMLKLSNQVGVDVRETSENLAVISKELTSTAMEQSADVKEILITMEDSNAFSKNISGRTANVSAGTDSTNRNIALSFASLREVIAQMDEIKASNIHTIEGIEQLKSQIDNIGDVVTLINDIADQTKIIAFNAELEAISAGDEGKNFHIVASEIRRLANSTTNSIHEIQDYIQGIQVASQKLIESSNNVTKCIEEETNLSHKLEGQFSSIQSSSDLTSSKASEISDIIEQQTSSFNQIVITLRQISAGIESFTESTKVISKASINAQEIAQELNSLTK